MLTCSRAGSTASEFPRHTTYRGVSTYETRLLHRNVQTICNLVDFGMNPQQAIEAPRWYSFPGTDPATIAQPFELHLESRLGQGVAEALAARGHQIVAHGPWGTAGKVQLITREPNGVLVGGCDPRGPSVALGV